jgi:hypothetical protein
MNEISDELLRRIAERASDPRRRYMTAAEDESRVSLPVEEIEKKFRDFSPEAGDVFREMQSRLRASGNARPTMSFVQRSDGTVGASSDPPGAKPLEAPPSESDWDDLEQICGWAIPDDLKRLYSIADGGFGPGFTGMNSVHGIGRYCEDYRRRGPDYTGEIHYPESFLPIANEMLDYHYDVETGRIISSDQDWESHELEKEDVYDIAFQSLADMMENWLRSP